MKNLIVSALLILSAFDAYSQNQDSNSKKKDSLETKRPKPNSARPAHWSYDGTKGPSNWGKLSPVYALCDKGKKQSPINIINSNAESGIHWNFNYKKSPLKITHNEHVDDIVDNGHTIQVTVEEGSTFILKGRTYHLKQFHFHTLSEHTLEGKHFPMEIHFVHQSDSGQFAVVGVFVEEGKENENIAKIVLNLPEKRGDTKEMKDVDLALQFHLPKTNEAYHYLGSLTTPPCSENVEWLVFKHPIQASQEQISAITNKIGPNNRPLQKLNKRKVQSDVIKGKTKN